MEKPKAARGRGSRAKVAEPVEEPKPARGRGRASKAEPKQAEEVGSTSLKPHTFSPDSINPKP